MIVVVPALHFVWFIYTFWFWLYKHSGENHSIVVGGLVQGVATCSNWTYFVSSISKVQRGYAKSTTRR